MECLYVLMVCVICVKVGSLLKQVSSSLPFFSGYDSYGVSDQDGFRTCRPTMSREYLCSPDAQGFSVHRQRWQRPGKQARTHSCNKRLVYQCSRSTQVECTHALWRICSSFAIEGHFKWVADLHKTHKASRLKRFSGVNKWRCKIRTSC